MNRFPISIAAMFWSAVALADTTNFESTIRPILSKHCYDCHGEGHRKGGLSLGEEKGALQGGDSLHPAYIAGKSGESAIIQRVLETDPAKRMPPKGDALAPNEIAALRAWIDGGAAWGNAAASTVAKTAGADFWSFHKPMQAPLPAVKDSAWVRNPIDAFILAHIEAAGLKPSPEADRYTLGRRVYLDLTGLPPSPAQIEAFVKDARPDAYERLVDDLLASPHYGERMAVAWLDAAHYADTNGFEKDRPRSIWPYRDWVINAFNRDMPFDRFVIEQYAGDLLPNATQDQRIATGFLRNTMINEEGGVDQEEYRYEAINDRIATTGMVFLGLTLNCAQCHSHKFDPITQREYYQFFAFLNNADEIEMPVKSAAITQQREAAQHEIDALREGLPAKFPTDPALRNETLLKASQANAESGGELKLLDDGTVLATGPAAEKDTYTLMLDVPAGTYTALELEALTDESQPKKGPGRADNGNFVLSEIAARLFPAEGGPKDLAFARAEASVEQGGFPVASALDGKPDTGWAVDVKGDGPNHDQKATFVFDNPVSVAQTTPLSVSLVQQFGGKHLLGKLRLRLVSQRLPEGMDEAAARQACLAKRFDEWRGATAAKCVPWMPLELVEASSKNHVTFEKKDDLSVLVKGDNPNTDTYTVAYRTDLQGITALRLEVLPDPSLPGGGPGRGIIMSPNEGDFLLSEIAASSAPWTAPEQETPIALKDPSQDFSAKDRDIGKALDGKMDTGWSVMGGEGKPHAAVFQFAQPVGNPGGTLLKLKLDQYYVHLHTIGRFRVSVTTAALPVQASGVPGDIEATLLSAEPDVDTLKAYFLANAPELAGEHNKIAALEKALPKYPTTLVLEEREQPRVTKIHHRGEFLAEREPVQADVPAVLPPLPGEAPRNRLTLARWLVSPENPLTPRVTVNRLWQAFFGRGLVGTSEDFGARGDRPSHPELLDWLAAEFVRRGWDVKDFVRLIVTSSTYRQDSLISPELLDKDPTNELLARGPRFRVDGEFVRDIALAASGLLTDKVGGPSVYPPLPDGMLDLVYASGGWKPSEGADKYRRALYTFWKRTMPYPTSITYDCPARDVAVVKRPRSNTPLQALTLLNDPVFVEAAQAMARRVLAEAPGAEEARLRYAFQLTTARPPDAEELERLRSFLNAQKERLAKDSAAAAAVTGASEGATPELAAWAALCRALLNLDETVSRG